MSEKQSRQYTEEFKQRALDLGKELGSVSAAVKRLGVPVATVHG